MNGMNKTERRLITLNDIDDIVERLPTEHADNAKRQLRTPLLDAFDVHKGNISYGAESETYEEKIEVLAWREKIKNLETEAFKNIPKQIKYYYRGS